MNFLLTVLVLGTLASCASHKPIVRERVPAQEFELVRKIELDMNKDGVLEMVELLGDQEEEFHTLRISSGGNVVLENKQFVPSYYNPGASLEVLPSGSFAIHADHTGIGRNPTERKFTVSFRKNKFVVSGYTMSTWDRMDPNGGGGSCDLNFLTGKGLRNGKPVKFKAVTKDLSVLKEEEDPKPCLF